MFSPPTQTWLAEAFPAPTEIQRRGWAAIASGAHSLLIAPTGSGKTLAAFLAAIDACAALPPNAPPGVRVLYVSPLKALVYDVERNLRAPLVGIGHAAARLGHPLRPVGVAIRTGDTPQTERQRQAKDPAEILVTTPESLFLILGANARETLRTVRTVIVDEIHALASTKRGTHLALSLERLAELTEVDPQRIGLSATVRPAEEIARFLGGDRPVNIVDASTPPRLDLAVTVPVPDMEQVQAPPRPERGGSILGELYAREVATPIPERGIWPAIYPQLLEQIRAHRATIVFVNSRGLCERLTQRLNELAGEALVRAHHGSVSHAQRTEIEEALKQGRLRGIVATSSLELGIDMGAIEQVILVESPGSVARGLQRVGRAGHQVGAVSSGRIFPKFRGDLLECAVIAARMRRGEIEALRVPHSPLDVLAQQIVAACTVAPRRVADLAALAARAHPYRELGRPILDGLIEMLAGHYPSDELAALRPLLAWDRSADLVTARRGAAMTVRMNAGTIPDRGQYAVRLGTDGPRLGELDEEMVFETRPGENILLGATTWHVEEITRDAVLVSPAPGEPGKLPFWHGDGPGRPIELGRALGAFLRELAGQGRAQAVDWLMREAPLDRYAAENLARYVFDQLEHTGALPTDRRITIERFRDELGDWRICLLTPFGARVHAPLAMALQHRLASDGGHEVQVMYTDDGIVLRFADAEELPALAELLPDPDEIDELVTTQLAETALFAGLFRENAARALLLPRRGPARRSPLWVQRLKAQELLAAVRRYPAFPIVIETYRQALADVFDLAELKELLRAVRSRRIRVDEVETRSASPFARSLVFAYVAAYIYEQDAPLAERRAQALTLDRGLLAELLGQAELRELIDPGVLAELEAELQHLAEERRARDADELHDLLRRLGDLSKPEIAARTRGDGRTWLEQLFAQQRAAAVRIAGEARSIAADEAALYRDALGVVPPPGLPQAFLDPPPQPLAHLLRRFARCHGPFVTGEPAARYGLPPGAVEPVLRALEAEGRLVRGELRPGGCEPEWCDAEVLRRLKRRTLARLRNAVAPVDAATLGRFLPDWHGLDGKRGGPERLLEVIAQLEGLALPWSTLHSVILPRRVAGFAPEMLDMLAAAGEIVWIGRGPLGARDGRIALYRRGRVARLLVPPPPPEDLEPLAVAILARLAERGASFLVELEEAARAAAPGATTAELEAALWDLVWAGRITNDTFAPLRYLGHARPRSQHGRWRPGRSLAGGRWSLVGGLVATPVSTTERALAQAEQLLERYGVVSREAAIAEDLPGGFGAVYRVLKELEETGRVRRGWFIEGLSGAQFALPGALDRLRAARPAEDDLTDGAGETACILAAIDPANPWGALLPWPPTGGADGRPRRVAGAWLITVGGLPSIYVAPGGRRIQTFPSPGDDDQALSSACEALHRLPRRRTLIVEQIDGVPARESPLAERLRACGFVDDYRGLAAEMGYSKEVG
ncbi:Lhr-like helicase [Thioflavicoccus mobilis 8321]|uniref:Lhr-like helicase n=1 Tax=Thioflavicoccus mobilis 8321 TaxID=765912 RepID=L0GX14_9GAMM|nr:DEAD/DEAH box helicase [Thioflavicoccus mobilis]AGA90372.1 Lhr-like helicase [Thioflavicoccus mobilis 8321]